MGACKSYQYSLPLIEFVGGEYKKIPFHVYHYIGRRPFDLAGCKCHFSVVNYTSQSGPVVISKEMVVDSEEDGAAANTIYVELSPDETISLFGKFVYQITIIGQDGSAEPIKQGIMNIVQNIDKEILK